MQRQAQATNAIVGHAVINIERARSSVLLCRASVQVNARDERGGKDNIVDGAFQFLFGLRTEERSLRAVSQQVRALVVVDDQTRAVAHRVAPSRAR